MTQVVVRSKDVDVEGVRKRLEEIKRQRVAEARRLGIFEMVKLVTTELGSKFWKVHGNYYVFPRMSEEEFRRASGGEYRLYMLYDDYGANAEVWYEGRKVFDASLGEITLYVPGSWVNQLINLYKAAKIEAAKKRVKAELEAIKKEALRWGLSLEDLGLCNEDLSV